MLVFEIDTQNEQQKAKNNMIPQNIVASTLRENTTKEEIDGVVTEIRKTQTRDLQQTQQK